MLHAKWLFSAYVDPTILVEGGKEEKDRKKRILQRARHLNATIIVPFLHKNAVEPWGL